MQVNQYREALRLIHQSDFTNHAIAQAIGISANTVSKCRTVSEKNNWKWRSVQAFDDRQLVACFQHRREQNSEKIMPDWPHIYKLMQVKHQTLIQLWEEYREVYKYDAYSYSQFTHHYRKFISQVDICMRQVHYAGEIVFVDYAGKTIPYRDSKTGGEKKAQVFVGVLGCSNYTFAWASASQRLEDWVEAHNQMFTFFGGVPSVVVPDNLKSAVTTPGRNIVLNKTYKELCEYYGLVVVPSRVRRPQDKSKAEIGVKLITRWISVPLSRQQFFSVDEINAAIAERLPAFNQRSFKRLPGCRTSRFDELDKPALKELPLAPFEYVEWTSEQKVGPDYHIYVKGHAYSVPYRLVSEKVSARISAKTVEIFCLNKRVASHLRDDTQGETTTNPNHRPVSHQVYASQTVEGFISWAKSIGEATTNIVKAQFTGNPNHSLAGRKACSKLQFLAKSYGSERIERACQRALNIHSPTFTSVKSILQHGLDDASNNSNVVLTHIPKHSNVRGSNYYRQGGKGHA